ncbi:MAG: transposase, partial [Acidobacteria bacterium]|nr:transposase [Acidobacteriota bacterium]
MTCRFVLDRWLGRPAGAHVTPPVGEPTADLGHTRHPGRGSSDHDGGSVELAARLTEAGCIHGAMEGTGVYRESVWHILEDAESFTLVVARVQHIRSVPAAKSDRKNVACIADLLELGPIRGSFVPPAPIQELRDLTRTRKQLVREVARHTQRLQKTLEDANMKLTRVVTDILGVSGRAILTAIIAAMSRVRSRDRLRGLVDARASVWGMAVAAVSRDRMRRAFGTTFLLAVLAAGCAQAAGSGAQPVDAREAATAAYFDSIRDEPAAVAAFLERMPVGGDIHHHLGGGVRTPELIRMAMDDRLCLPRDHAAQWV